MACEEQRKDVVLDGLIRKWFSLLIPIAEKAREDVFMSSDQASIPIPPSLLNPDLQVLSYRIRSCECFTICRSWDVDWQLKEAFHHGVEGSMEHVVIFSVLSPNKNLTSYGEHELLHQGKQNDFRFAMEMLLNEPDEDAIDASRVPLQGFGPQEHHESVPDTCSVRSNMADQGFSPQNTDNATGP